MPRRDLSPLLPDRAAPDRAAPDRAVPDRADRATDGGASLGAVQVGMAAALYEAGVVPDLLLGTSVGAMNAAYLGLHPGVEGVQVLARLWKTLRRRDLVRLHAAQVLAALAGFGPARRLVVGQPDIGAPQHEAVLARVSEGWKEGGWGN
ncbi:MAG: patatin-like phospholipase family protein [Acidimicrobiales bacterium]